MVEKHWAYGPEEVIDLDNKRKREEDEKKAEKYRKTEGREKKKASKVGSEERKEKEKEEKTCKGLNCSNVWRSSNQWLICNCKKFLSCSKCKKVEECQRSYRSHSKHCKVERMERNEYNRFCNGHFKVRAHDVNFVPSLITVLW